MASQAWAHPYSDKEIRVYYEQGHHDHVLASIAKTVRERFSTPAQHDKQVVIFDVDEVSLSPYPFFEHVTRNGSSWRKIHECPNGAAIYYQFLKHIQLPPFEHIYCLYRHFVDLGYKIIFLTYRPYEVREETLHNLRAVGYVDFDRLITPPAEPLALSGGAFKEQARIQLTAEGYEIVCCLDDYEENLQGAYVGHAVKIPSYFHR